jgi:hypothetical protein
MQQIKQKGESPTKGGFSDTRLRFYILGFMTLGLIMIPASGMIASFGVVMIFAIFTAVKIVEFQSHNVKSILLHRQAMDRMYNYSQKAEYYDAQIKSYDRLHESQKPIKAKHLVSSKNYFLWFPKTTFYYTKSA